MTDEPSTPTPAGGPQGQDRPGGGGGGRRRLPPVPVEVVSVSRLTPRLISIRVTADDLGRFGRGRAHLAHQGLPARSGQDAPTMPIMTPERTCVAGGPTETDGAHLHAARLRSPDRHPRGAVPASRCGSCFGVGGTRSARRQACDRRPGGRFTADSSVTRWWIAGDESALPAVGTLLDVLPPSATAEVHLEVEGSEDEIGLESAADVTVHWHHRRYAETFGGELVDAAVGAEIAGRRPGLGRVRSVGGAADPQPDAR